MAFLISSLIFVSIAAIGYQAGLVLNKRLNKANLMPANSAGGRSSDSSGSPAVGPLDMGKGKLGAFLKADARIWGRISNRVNIPELNRAEKRLSAIFITVSRPKLLRMYLASFVILGIIGIILFKNIIGLVVGCVIAAILPKLMVRQLEAKHKSLFSSQLVDALMILSSSLKAGLSLIQAIEEVVTELPAPISREFDLVMRENRMGVPLEEALLHLKNRMELEELNLVVTAILVARETGGDLTQTFAQLTLTIREKKKLHGRVNALCVQAKLQGIIMGLLPIGFAIFVCSMNPGYFNKMLQESVGQALLGYAVVSEIIGLILIKKLSRIEV